MEVCHVLSQLLWDLQSATSANLLHTLKSFQKSLLSDPHVDSEQEMIDHLVPAFECIDSPTADFAERYLALCEAAMEFPYKTFLVSLSDILKMNEPWKSLWNNLSAQSQSRYVSLRNALDQSIEDLFARNIVSELRHTVDERKKIVNEYYRMRWSRAAFLHRDNFLVNLKGLSSSSPLIYNNTFGSHLRGGGFYFRWNSVGVVVDPGLSFVANMHEHGLSIHDINVVIVTHDHLDHTGDIQLLEDLEYQICKANKIQWFICKELGGKICSPNQRIVQPGEELNISSHIRMHAIQTQHIEDPPSSGSYKATTFGCYFDLLPFQSSAGHMIANRRIGYTSDTKYHSNFSRHFNALDLLIANISSVRESDLQFEQQNPYHLGYQGCMKMLLEFSQPPKYFLLSEFWNGIEDIRFSVTKQMQRTTHRKSIKTSVLPTEIGMEIALDRMLVKCTCCGNYSSSVRLIRPKLDFECMQYVCDECIL